MPLKWYVYELSDKDGVFYVGKGTGKRISDTLRDGSREKQRRSVNCKQRIVALFESEQDALDHEEQLILQYGIDNLTNINLKGNKGKEHIHVSKESFLYEWSKVHKITLYKNDNRREAFVIVAKIANILSGETACRSVVGEKVLVDLGAHLIKKLLRFSKTQPKQVKCQLITCCV